MASEKLSVETNIKIILIYEKCIIQAIMVVKKVSFTLSTAAKNFLRVCVLCHQPKASMPKPCPIPQAIQDKVDEGKKGDALDLVNKEPKALDEKYIGCYLFP